VERGQMLARNRLRSQLDFGPRSRREKKAEAERDRLVQYLAPPSKAPNA
jgi:hypothetical protein